MATSQPLPHVVLICQSSCCSMPCSFAFVNNFTTHHATVVVASCMQSAPSTPLPTSSITSKGSVLFKFLPAITPGFRPVTAYCLVHFFFLILQSVFAAAPSAVCIPLFSGQTVPALFFNNCLQFPCVFLKNVFQFQFKVFFFLPGQFCHAVSPVLFLQLLQLLCFFLASSSSDFSLAAVCSVVFVVLQPPALQTVL